MNEILRFGEKSLKTLITATLILCGLQSVAQTRLGKTGAEENMLNRRVKTAFALCAATAAAMGLPKAVAADL